MVTPEITVEVKVGGDSFPIFRRVIRILSTVERKPLFDFTIPVDPTGKSFDELATLLSAANAELARRYGWRFLRRPAQFGSVIAAASSVSLAFDRLGQSAQLAAAQAAEYQRAVEEWKYAGLSKESVQQVRLWEALLFTDPSAVEVSAEIDLLAAGTHRNDEAWQRTCLWRAITPWWLPGWAQTLIWKIVERWPMRWLPALEEDKEE